MDAGGLAAHGRRLRPRRPRQSVRRSGRLLAGTARYLVERGHYRRGEAWGCEVKSDGRGAGSWRTYAQWQAARRPPRRRQSLRAPGRPGEAVAAGARRPGLPDRAEFPRRLFLQSRPPATPSRFAISATSSRGDRPSTSSSPAASACRPWTRSRKSSAGSSQRGFKTDGIDGRTGQRHDQGHPRVPEEGRHEAGRRLCRLEGSGPIASGPVIRFGCRPAALGAAAARGTCVEVQARSARAPSRDTSLSAIDRPMPAGVNAAGFGSDVVADALRALDIPYIALNPGASYRGLHDSLVNYLGNERPQMLLCLHEESAVAIAHGYAKVTGKAMAAAVHSNVGLMHATMAIFNAWCDRMPMRHARRHRAGRRGQAPALDRLDPHRARPGRAGARLHQMGRPAGLARRRARSDSARRLDRQYRAARADLRQSRRRHAGSETRPSRCRRSRRSASCRRSPARRRAEAIAQAAGAAARRQAAADPGRPRRRAISTPGTRASRWPSGSTRASSPT